MAVTIKEKPGAEYDILYDENLVVAKEMGLFYRNAVPVFSDRAAERMSLDDVPTTSKRADLSQPATLLFDAMEG